MTQGTFHHGFGGGAVMFFKDILFKGARVDADPNGDIDIFGTINHGFYVFMAADVSGINPQPIGTGTGGGNCQPVVKMNIGDKRDRDLFFNGRNGIRSLSIGYSHPYNFAAGTLQTLDLRNGSTYIRGRRIGHGLNRNEGRLPPPEHRRPVSVVFFSA